ncbi:hypothetical protein SEA_PIPPA_46 [Arthrobacter phage Pippa]|nr:hypothetical protein SEA_PIPPA_46 [Arthrobacter phage Pippa]
MSAELSERYVGYCAECNDGIGPVDDSDDAEAWIDQHNSEYHSDVADALEELVGLMTQRDIEIDAELETADEMTRNDHK